ncbi:hypothetical protein HN865_00925 [Candidatus Woesearchaeota archaeon]|jgi:hypothetical protein|nr:hypothetical protein [Candidatus Woesearchaeota archaeon]MBT7237399.1 hypothetical protein [Candidatus Woesearchaeota archaeon]
MATPYLDGNSLSIRTESLLKKYRGFNVSLGEAIQIIESNDEPYIIRDLASRHFEHARKAGLVALISTIPPAIGLYVAQETSNEIIAHISSYLTTVPLVSSFLSIIETGSGIWNKTSAGLIEFFGD